MPPQQQLQQQKRRTKHNNNGPVVWPTIPGSTSPYLQIPAAPTMNEIQEAFEVSGVACEGDDLAPRNEGPHLAAATAGFETPCNRSLAVAEECTGNGTAAPAHDATGAASYSTGQQSVSTANQSRNPVSLPSPHVPFMGYMDKNGIIHQNEFGSSPSQTAKLVDQSNERRDKKKAPVASMKAVKLNFSEEEKTEVLGSVEDILQASLNFEKSNPEKRFSSSLDNIYCSASTRNLYPSLEDFGEPPLAPQEAWTREASADSVRTTCAAVLASAAKSAAASARAEKSVVPKPPGEEPYAIASAAYEVQTVDDDEDVKIGVARAGYNRADTDSPAYAVAEVDNNTEYASAEATVLGTSETPEEALLAKLAAEDAELLALKRSAYGGGYEGTPGFQSTAAGFPDQQATVVSISEEYHPAEVSTNEVRAELIGEDYGKIPAIGTPSTGAASRPAAASAPATISHHASVSHAVFALEESGYAFVESEATVIGGGGTWQATHAEEAIVLNDEASVPYSDRKLPAVDLSDANKHSTPPRDNGDNNFSGHTSFPSVTATAQCEADVIAVTEGAYYEHAYYEAATYGGGSNVVCASADDGAASGVAYVEAEEGGFYGNPSGVAFAGEHAEVVEIREDFHPAEVSGNEAQAELVSGAEITYANNDCDEQAEVVGISEEYHPAEVSGNEALAELVAEDYGAAVAVQNISAEEQAQVVEISEDFHPAEFTDATRADFVREQYGDAMAHLSHSGVQATALPAGDTEGIQAATVVGYEDDGDMISSPVSRANSCGLPIPDRTPPSARAYTAPAAVGTRIDPVHTPLTQATGELDTVIEEDWMRTPPLSGNSEGHAVVVMQPPAEGVSERPAVAVAALEAYDDATPPAMYSTSFCSPAGSPQPALAVTLISAYASAPASPDFDDTDCSMVNRRPAPNETTVPEMSTNSAGDDAEPAMPHPRPFNSAGNSDSGSVNSSNSLSTSNTRGGFQKISNSFARGMEMLFGDTKPSSGKRSQASDNASLAKSVMPRQLLPWSVIYSEATNMWVATVNTNQKALDSKNVVEASKSLRAFSVVTERQATCLAKAWSPPRMHAFNKNPACHICKAKFAVFRRACHCRNCGVAICVSSNGCSRPWPAKMCPETYNIKKESFLNVCAACDFLCTEFRLALLEGNRDKAIALHATGNINLVTPFANVKGELFYPVHCAALGGNLDLLKWLVDENCCPIKSVRVSGRSRDASNSFTEISTSKGRSLLGIALENRNVGIVRYLIVDKGIQLSGEKDITMDTLCRNLELVLRLLPEDAATGNSNDHIIPGFHHDEVPDQHLGQHNVDTNVRGMDTASDGSVNDACIICFDHSIDCVATPCGHQVCCLDCGRNITRCPVCAAECSFMRVFRP